MPPQLSRIGIIIGIFIAVSFGAFWARSYIAMRYYQQGLEAYARADFTSALQKINIARRINPREPRAAALLGRLYYANAPEREGAQDAIPADHRKAIGYYEEAIKLGLQNIDFGIYLNLLDDLGKSYELLGDFDSANKWYLKRIEASPQGSSLVRFWVARDYYQRLNKPDEALTLLEPVLSAPDILQFADQLGEIYLLLARLYFYTGDLTKSEEFANLAIRDSSSKNNSTEERARITLALIYAASTKFRAATSEVQHAEQIAMQDGKYRCVLAQIHITAKNFSAAQIAAREPFDGSEWYPLLCLNALGKAAQGLGNPTAARNFLTRYLAAVSQLPNKTIFDFRESERVRSILAEL